MSYVANIGGKTHTTGEYFDPNTQSVKQWTNITSPSNNTTQTFSTNNIGGALYMMFYFNGK